jgi:hydrogenase-1 operon protein HyaF
MKKIDDIPVVVVGPGSQPIEEDTVLETPKSPGEMNVYSMPDLSVIEGLDERENGMQLLYETEKILNTYKVGSKPDAQSLEDMSEIDLELINQVLGNGEVSIVYNGDVHMQIQESVLAGLWRIQHIAQDGQVIKDLIEVADVPSVIREAAFINTTMPVAADRSELPEGVQNAPPLIVEICEKVDEFKPGAEPHIINLSLLPQTEEDLVYINEQLGVGPVTILSRGYGNCRITSTNTANVWWVQYFNSDDTNILNTIEISDVPAVACAAQEDIEDSAERLHDILEVYA